MVPATRAAETKGPQNGYLKEKNYFFCSTHFKLLSQIKENSINNYDLIKFNNLCNRQPL
jgi:hypothetical protein